MQLPTAISRSLGWAAFEFARLQPFIPTYLHLIASALFPIYAGSHASLSRPTSAAKKVKSEKNKDDTEDESEDEDESTQKMEGLSATDAMMFPILAGATLTGLYFLIKWLQDPALLNKILNWYFAIFSIFSVSRLVSDGLDVVHSIAFPHAYVDGGVLYSVNKKLRQAIPSSSTRPARRSPLPSYFSRVPLPDVILSFLWRLHLLPNRKLQFKAYVRHLLRLQFRLGIHGIEGLVVGICAVAWYNFVSKPWWLTNLMGFGFAYGTLQILSPTTFWTGTLVLSGLFFYDIYFVFFTPIMVTVAKSLDIPIKLLFPRPADPGDDSAIQALSMLGLGDVVLPGIVIGLALRFDLYLFYLRKQKQGDSNEASLSSTRRSKRVGNGTEVGTELGADKAVVKATYISVAEAWGDRLWTSTLLTGSSKAHGYVARNAFPKTYFHASLMGYVIGMLATLGAMQISNHAQPALLYLVPGVLTSLWATAWVKGDAAEMWRFSDAAEEEDDGKKDSADGKDGKKDGADEAQKTGSPTKQRSKISSKTDDHTEKSEETARSQTERRALFSVSIHLPPPLPTEPAKEESSDEAIKRYSLRSKESKTGEPAGKRQRVS